MCCSPVALTLCQYASCLLACHALLFQSCFCVVHAAHVTHIEPVTASAHVTYLAMTTWHQTTDAHHASHPTVTLDLDVSPESVVMLFSSPCQPDHIVFVQEQSETKHL